MHQYFLAYKTASLGLASRLLQTVYAQYASSYRRLIHVGSGPNRLPGTAGLAAAVLLCIALPASAQPAGANQAAGNGVKSDAAAPATDARARPEAEQQWMRDYMAGDRPEGAMWLAEGEQAFIGIYQDAVEPYQMGVLLLANRPQDLLPGSALQQLASYLPLHGWSSLIALLPAAPAPPPLAARTLLPGGSVPPAGDNDDSAAGQDSADSDNNANSAASNNGNDSSAQSRAADPATIAAQRIASAGRWLLDKGARSLTLVTTGGTLQWALRAAVADAQNTSGLVLWQVDAAALDNEILAALRESRVSILDILPTQLDAQPKLARKHLFQRAGFGRDYRPINIALQPGPAAITNASAAVANKRVRHWLNSEFEKN